MRLSLSARVSSEGLRWCVTLLTPFFFADVAAFSGGAFFAEAGAGLIARNPASASVQRTWTALVRHCVGMRLVRRMWLFLAGAGESDGGADEGGWQA